MPEKVKNKQKVEVENMTSNQEIMSEGKNKGKKFYTCKDDRAFKEFFMNEKNKDILVGLLESILKVKIKEIEYLNLERNSDNVHVRRKHLDLNLETDIGRIEIEVNASNEKYVRPRNTAYLCDIYSHYVEKGKKYDEDTLIMQINFSYGISDSEYVRKYSISDETGKQFVKNFIIYEINMSKYQKIWYNVKNFMAHLEQAKRCVIKLLYLISNEKICIR